jgi:hypothetical protein
MKRHSVRLIAAAFVVAGIAGCFSDPASSLRNGPAAIVLNRNDVYLAATLDSVQIEARLQDSQGNNLVMSDVAWTTDDGLIADVHVAAKQEPNGLSSRAFIIATAAASASTTVRVTSRGVEEPIRVTRLP